MKSTFSVCVLREFSVSLLARLYKPSGENFSLSLFVFSSSLLPALAVMLFVVLLGWQLTSSNFLAAGKAAKEPPARGPRRLSSIRLSEGASPGLSLSAKRNTIDRTQPLRNRTLEVGYVYWSIRVAFIFVTIKLILLLSVSSSQ